MKCEKGASESAKKKPENRLAQPCKKLKISTRFRGGKNREHYQRAHYQCIKIYSEGGSSKSARKVCKEQHQQQQQSGKVFHIKVCSRESSRKIAGLGLGNLQCVFVFFPSLSFRLSKITLNKLVRKDLGGILSGVAAKMLLAL